MKNISASSLVEYLHSSPSRRAAIIRTAISPPVFLVDRYGITQRVARQALSSRSIGPLQIAHEMVSKKVARNQFHKSRIANTLESLEGTKQLLMDYVAADLGYARPSPVDASCEIEGMNVRVSPTSIVFTRNPSGGLEVGILKLHCSKSFRLSTTAAADYGALLHWYADTKLGPMGSVSPELCILLDVFSGEKFKAPKSFKMRRKTLSEACQEIADRWDRVASREIPRTSDISTVRRAGQ
jgi:hypothetical protein